MRKLMFIMMMLIGISVSSLISYGYTMVSSSIQKIEDRKNQYEEILNR